MKLEILDIYKSFGEKKVLNGVSFSAESGEAVGLLGRNGAGKTTTIRIIMGLFNADSGQILIDGKPIDRGNVKIGYLPEERGMYPKKTIYEQIIYFSKLKGMSSASARASADFWLDRLEMNEYRNKLLNTLSKGNQQKIQLAVALANDPDVVILDEPFSGLDPVNAMMLKDVIKELIDKDKTVLFSSHQMNYIEEFCENIVIMNGGKIVLAGETEKIKRSYSGNRIVINSSDNAALADYLKVNFNGYSSIENDGERLYIVLNSVDLKPKLMDILIKSGLDIDKFERWEPTLNDIFVEYTENSIN